MPITHFTSEYELQKVVQRCHNVLWERHGFDPAQAFDEFSKLLFVRLYDEMTMGGLRTTVQRGETVEHFANRIRRLFEQANETPGFDGIFTDQRIVVDDLAIWEVFRNLQNYSLLETTSQVQGADVKGTIYEHILGNTFRGELGQFFTHRNIVEFMVRLVGVDESRVVYDPACGSGGFLIMCARIIRENWANRLEIPPQELDRRLRDYSRHCLIGTEINERTARVARLNFLMHGLDYRNVFTANALKVDESDHLRDLVGEERVDIVFANPPFAGYEKEPTILSRFELGRNSHGNVASVTREVLFIERIIRALRDGGIAGIVLPQGIFTNRLLKHVRDYIRSHAQILAVIELPDWAFIPSGTSVRGSLLFLRKTFSPPREYEIFMRRVENIGFTSTGRPTESNDFPRVIEEFRRKDPRYMVPFSELQDRLDAKFYISEHRRVAAFFRNNPQHNLVRLSDLGTFYTEKVNPHRYPEEEFQLIETGCIDPETLVISPKRIKGKESNYTSLKRVHAGDILISRRRAYRGAVVIIPPELDGALAIPEFSVLRLQEGYDRDYVVEILRSPQFLQLMTIYSTGEMSGRIAEKDLRLLQIPIHRDHHRIGAIFREYRQRIRHLTEQVAEQREQIARLCSRIIEGLNG